MRVLGLDLGRRRIGLALGDTESRIAIGLPTIYNDRQAVENLRAIIEGERVGRLIVGLPKTMSGTTGKQAAYTREWAEKIARLLGVMVAYEDERLSSKMARDGLLAVKGKLKKEDIDQAAAVLILQSYLDRPH